MDVENGNWTKLPAVAEQDIYVGCLSCSSAASIAPMDMIIAVGFGMAEVTRNGHPVYQEDSIKDNNYWTVKDAETMAARDPDHDWRITKEGALHGETFQRQGINQWVCVESNKGFA